MTNPAAVSPLSKSEFFKRTVNILLDGDHVGLADAMRRVEEQYATLRELLAADREYDEAHSELAELNLGNYSNDQLMAALERVDDSVDRRAAALAAFGGES